VKLEIVAGCIAQKKHGRDHRGRSNRDD